MLEAEHPGCGGIILTVAAPCQAVFGLDLDVAVVLPRGQFRTLPEIQVVLQLNAHFDIGIPTASRRRRVGHWKVDIRVVLGHRVHGIAELRVIGGLMRISQPLVQHQVGREVLRQLPADGFLIRPELKC